MSVYSYVELKVHTNVRKVGTHLNVCFINRTYVCWKYTCLFDYKNYCSIYLYIMNICSSVGTRTLSLPRPFLFPYYISIYKKRNTLSRTFFTFPAPLLTFILCYYIYSIYRDVHTFPQLFTPFPIVLLYSLYIEEGTLCPPLFYPL